MRTRRRWGVGARWVVPGATLAAGLALAMGALRAGHEAKAIPPFPQIVSGLAKIDGASAADGAVVTVQVDDMTCNTVPIAVLVSSGAYYLAIQYTEPSPCPAAGPTKFFINGVLGAQRASLFSNPAAVTINALTVGATSTSTGATPTSTLVAPTPSPTAPTVSSSTPSLTPSAIVPTRTATSSSSATPTTSATPKPTAAGYRVVLPLVAVD